MEIEDKTSECSVRVKAETRYVGLHDHAAHNYDGCDSEVVDETTVTVIVERRVAK